MNGSASKRLKGLVISMITAALMLALTSLALVSCDSGIGSTDEDQTITLTEADNGTARTVSVGDTVIVTLEGNPTTGYEWASDLTEDDSTLLRLVGGQPTYVPDEVASDIVGSGGVYTFTFEAMDAGQVDLKLKYWRSFEADVEPIDTFSVDLTIE